MDKDNKKIKILQISPKREFVFLKGLYLEHKLLKISQELHRPFVYTDYVSDVNDVIAKKDEGGNFKVPDELKNPSDWQLFAELEAQSEVIITASGYLRRFSTQGKAAQDILSSFEAGGKFEYLGKWRLKSGYASRSPDIAIVSRSLDFEIPKDLARKMIVFTINKMVDSSKGKIIKNSGVSLVDGGTEGVDGKIMIDVLCKMGYRTIEMVTGPRILKILLNANVLDRIYISQVQRDIISDNPSSVVKILVDGGKVENLEGFKLSYRYLQEKITMADGEVFSQKFLVYDKKNLR